MKVHSEVLRETLTFLQRNELQEEHLSHIPLCYITQQWTMQHAISQLYWEPYCYSSETAGLHVMLYNMTPFVWALASSFTGTPWSWASAPVVCRHPPSWSFLELPSHSGGLRRTAPSRWRPGLGPARRSVWVFPGKPPRHMPLAVGEEHRADGRRWTHAACLCIRNVISGKDNRNFGSLMKWCIYPVAGAGVGYLLTVRLFFSQSTFICKALNKIQSFLYAYIYCICNSLCSRSYVLALAFCNKPTNCLTSPRRVSGVDVTICCCIIIPKIIFEISIDSSVL